MIEAHFSHSVIYYRSAPTPIRDGAFCVVNPDYEQHWGADFDYQYHVSRNTRDRVAYGAVSGQGIPAPCRFVDDRFVKLTCPLQWWIHNMNCERLSPSISEATRKSWFRSMFRDNAFITNKLGTNSEHDCINGTNEESGEPRYQPMAMGGALLRLSGERRMYGQDCHLVDAINPHVEFEKYHYSTHPWLFFPPTISARLWIFDWKGNIIDKQEWYEEPMHFYAEMTRLPVFGFIQNDKSLTGWSNVVPKYRCRVLKDSEAVPNPFILRGGRIVENPYEGF